MVTVYNYGGYDFMDLEQLAGTCDYRHLIQLNVCPALYTFVNPANNMYTIILNGSVMYIYTTGMGLSPGPENCSATGYTGCTGHRCAGHQLPPEIQLDDHSGWIQERERK